MQIGSLTAFLSYLVQILMSIMMATFMLVLIPRAAVCAERLTEVLETDSTVVTSGEIVTELLPLADEVHELQIDELRAWATEALPTSLPTKLWSWS
mgnify:CR=1 FL=1